jgi:hypothetical protein
MGPFKLENLGKPTNKKWKKVAIFLSRSLPAYIGAVAIAPIPDNVKLWITFFLSLAVATVSGLSEFTIETEI